MEVTVSAGVHTYMHTYVRTHIHIYVHTYIPWIHKFVRKTAGGGTSHKYTNIHNFYSVKYYKNLTKTVL
jgi:hypothetical protein